jgi:Protein of unknown function (DUF2865)
MTFRSILALCVPLAGLVAAEAAQAQSAACQRYRAELAALERGGGWRAAGAAQRQRVEIARMIGYFHSIGCRQGWFVAGAAYQCAAIADRIRAMQSTYAQLRQVQPYDSGARRRQLMAAIQDACQPQREARPGRDDDDRPRGSLGGSRIVCVRSCDGFFFPLSHAPGGRSGADEMCQALCPGAETAAYSMPGGETTELDRALSLKGKPYTRLIGAFKFQKAFDPSCFCKKDGQTWAQVLARAETMLGRRPGDIIVTAQKAEELSRPKIAMAARRGRDKKKPADVESTGSVPIVAHASAAVPTASQASAGIGPKSIEGAKVLDRTDGPKRELTDDQGAKRTVRIVAPTIIPVPAQAPSEP